MPNESHLLESPPLNRRLVTPLDLKLVDQPQGPAPLPSTTSQGSRLSAHFRPPAVAVNGNSTPVRQSTTLQTILKAFRGRLFQFITSGPYLYGSLIACFILSFSPNIPIVGALLASITLIPALYMTVRTYFNLYDFWNNQDKPATKHVYRWLVFTLATCWLALTLRNIAVILDSAHIITTSLLMPLPSWILVLVILTLSGIILWQHNLDTASELDGLHTKQHHKTQAPHSTTLTAFKTPTASPVSSKNDGSDEAKPEEAWVKPCRPVL